MESLLFLSSFFLSTILTGMSFFILGVHYPLFAVISRIDFRKYLLLQAEYSQTFFVVPMFLDLIFALMLIYIRPPFISEFNIWIAFLLTLSAWAASFTIRISLQQKLIRKGNGPENLKKLLTLHWLITVSWTLKSGIYFYSLSNLFQL